MNNTAQIPARLNDLQTRINQAASEAGRDINEITLVAVSKGHPSALVNAGYEAGLRVFGENYAEEGKTKMEDLSGLDGLQWHMIGHIQSRKARLVSQEYDMIHSIDSLKIAKRIDRFASEHGKVIPGLLEFNISGEPTKHGWMASDPSSWSDLIEEVSHIAELRNIEIRGLMTIAPYSSQPEDSRPYYQRLCQLQDYLGGKFPRISWHDLSMGMSSDFEVAIEEGATLLRIGEAIFGPRPPK